MDILLMRHRRAGAGMSANVDDGDFLGLIAQMIAARDEALDIKAAIAAA